MGQRTPCPYPCLIWDHNESTYFICFHIFSDWNQIQTHSVTLHLASFRYLHIIRIHHWRHLTEMAQSLRSRAVLRAAKVRHGHSFSASQVPCWNRWLLEDCFFSNHWSIFHGWIRESRVFHVERKCFLLPVFCMCMMGSSTTLVIVEVEVEGIRWI